MPDLMSGLTDSISYRTGSILYASQCMTAAAMEKITPSGTRVSHLDNNIPLVFAAKKRKQPRPSSRARDSTLARLLAHQGVPPVPFSQIVIFEKLVKTGLNHNNRSILICKRRLQSP